MSITCTLNCISSAGVEQTLVNVQGRWCGLLLSLFGSILDSSVCGQAWAAVSQRTFLGGLICFLLPAYVSKMLLVKWKTCQFLATLTQVESEVLWFIIHQPRTASD